MCLKASVVLVDVDLAEVHRPHGAVGDLDVVSLAGTLIYRSQDVGLRGLPAVLCCLRLLVAHLLTPLPFFPCWHNVIVVCVSLRQSEMQKVPRAFVERLTDAVSYSAKWLKSSLGNRLNRGNQKGVIMFKVAATIQGPIC